jgi:hypothetical protein
MGVTDADSPPDSEHANEAITSSEMNRTTRIDLILHTYQTPSIYGKRVRALSHASYG